MAEVTVRIDDVETYHGVSKKTDKEYTKFSVKAGGKKYVTFKREIVEPAGALKNQLAVLTYSEDDYGYTLEGVSAATGAPETPSQDTLGTQAVIESVWPPNAPTVSKDISIARAVAFKGAVELAAAGVLTLEGPASILDIAEAFTPWLLNTQATASPPPEDNPFADLSEEPVDAKGELVKF